MNMHCRVRNQLENDLDLEGVGAQILVLQDLSVPLP